MTESDKFLLCKGQVPFMFRRTVSHRIMFFANFVARAQSIQRLMSLPIVPVCRDQRCVVSLPVLYTQYHLYRDVVLLSCPFFFCLLEENSSDTVCVRFCSFLHRAERKWIAHVLGVNRQGAQTSHRTVVMLPHATFVVFFSISQSQLLEDKVRELTDCHDQLEVAREAEEEYERRLDEAQAKSRRKLHALQASNSVVDAQPLLSRRKASIGKVRERIIIARQPWFSGVLVGKSPRQTHYNTAEPPHRWFFK